MGRQKSFEFAEKAEEWATQYTVSRAEIARHYGVAVNTIKGREQDPAYPAKCMVTGRARYKRYEVEEYFDMHPFDFRAQEAANMRPYKQARGDKATVQLQIVREALREIYANVGELLRKTDLCIQQKNSGV